MWSPFAWKVKGGVKMKKFFSVFGFLLVLLTGPCVAAPAAGEASEAPLDIKEMVFEHIGDSYEFHIGKWGDTEVTVPLPVIVRGLDGRWHAFLSSRFRQSAAGEDDGFYLSREGEYKGKVVERNPETGQEARPFDLSITKTVFALLLNSTLLCVLILWLARLAKKSPEKTRRGLAGAVMLLVTDIEDSVIKPAMGEDYRRYSPYLLTVFFFIFFNNLTGLIPIFPAGANVTGNIAVTFVLALCTFLVTAFSGCRHYWKEIFWPDVPLAMKPLMIPVEIVGMFTKPFALMIRLFANMMAGHTVIFCMMALIFITATMHPVVNGSMTVVSVLFSMFMYVLELLVAYIQAYVFTMLSAVFIGQALEGRRKKDKVCQTN